MLFELSWAPKCTRIRNAENSPCDACVDYQRLVMAFTAASSAVSYTPHFHHARGALLYSHVLTAEEFARNEVLTAEEFTHNEDKYIPDPFPFYARMREESPSYHSDRIFGGTWLFFRYADNVALMADERLSNARAAVPLWFLPGTRSARPGTSSPRHSSPGYGAMTGSVPRRSSGRSSRCSRSPLRRRPSGSPTPLCMASHRRCGPWTMRAPCG
jgi:hypothetical protein